MNQPDWSMDAEFRPTLPDRGSSLARAVSGDLEEIFAAVPAETPQAPRSGARVRTLAKPQARAPASRLAGLGAVAAALLAGVVLGSILLRPHPGPKPAPAAMAPATAPGAADLPAPPPVVAQAQARATAPSGSSKPVVQRAGASRASVMAADRRLRRAYASAARAGVPRGVLVAARNRWSATRNAPPGRLVAVYAALAGDLERRAAHGRRLRRVRG